MPSLTDSSDFQYIVFRDFKNDHIPEILDEVYLKQVYQPFLQGKKDLTILDIGANQGLTAYYFKDYGQVYAVEPSRQHLETLDEMIKLNKIENIKVLPYAVSNKTGKQTFFNSTNRTAFSLTNFEPGVEKEEVDTITLKELLEREKIDKVDILKLDVEGEESKIIASDEFAEISPRLPVILGEYHDWTDMNKYQFMHRFRDLGYDFTWRFDTKAAVFEAVR